MQLLCFLGLSFALAATTVCSGTGLESMSKSPDVCDKQDATCAGEPHSTPADAVKDMWKLLEMFELPTPMETETTKEGIDSSACNIERVSLLNDRGRAERMLNERIDVKYQNADLPPIILTDLRAADLQRELLNVWGNVNSLLERFGKHSVFAGPPVKLPVLNQATFQDYVNYSRAHPVNLSVSSSALDFDYQFKRANLVPPSDWRMSTISLTDKNLETYLEPPVFAYQPKLLGLPFHGHGPTVNEIISGRKYWLFYRRAWGCNETLLQTVLPGNNWTSASFLPASLIDKSSDSGSWSTEPISCDSITRIVANRFVNVSPKEYSAMAKRCRAAVGTRDSCASLAVQRNDLRLTARWLTEVLPRLEPDSQPTHRCSTYAGEAMVIPSYYWHATLNLEDSIIFVRGNNLDYPQDNPVPVCTKDFGGGKILLQFWNTASADLDVFWRNTTSGDAKHTLHLPGMSSQELRTFRGLKFSIWHGESLRVMLDAGQQFKAKLILRGSYLTDVSTWDSCNFHYQAT